MEAEPTKFTLCKCGHHWATHAGRSGCFGEQGGPEKFVCECKGFEAQPTEMDLMNRQCVAMRPSDHRVFIHRASDICLVGLSPSEALNLAAWLVAVADGKAHHTFDEVREAIEGG